MTVRAFFCAVILCAVVVLPRTGAAAAGSNYELDLSSVECFEPIGRAPELREVVRRRTGTDPGVMLATAVRLDRAALSDIEASFPAPSRSKTPGFMHTGGDSIELDIETLDGRREHGTTTFMPRDGVLMFILPEAAVTALKARRSRCGARALFDPQPFRALHRAVRENLRAILDQERQ